MNNKYDLNKLVIEQLMRPAPKSCEQIDKLLTNLPIKSMIHHQQPTLKQEEAFELLRQKAITPTLDEIRYFAEICCGKYHRIRKKYINWPKNQKAKELYQQYYQETNFPEIKYIIDNFDQFIKLCMRNEDRRVKKDYMAGYNDTSLSKSLDPDSKEWKN